MYRFILTGLLSFVYIACFAQHNPSQWGDLENGYYRNQILPSDYSDPDILRLDKDYYMISSTFQFSGGIVILHSRDLVNWKTIGYVCNDLPNELKDNRFDYSVMDHYDKGIYAASLRYHDNKFRIYFTTYNKGGFYVATAKKMTGPWKIQIMKDMNGKELFGLNWDDPCPFWDNDGKAYLLASNPGENWFPILFQLSPDGTTLLDGAIEKMRIKTLDQTNRGTNILPKATWGEGNKIFKMKGYYYLYHNECFGEDYDRQAVMIRSRNIYGTKPDGTPGAPGDPGLYDISPQGSPTYLMVHPDSTDGRFDQGGLVDTPDGKKWYFLTHQGGGYPNGRPISLLPVTWIDGWPMAGVDHDHDNIGEPVWNVEKPLNGYPRTYPQGSDEFNGKRLDPQWMWNYQPRKEKWSLTERKGFLRLHAFQPLERGNFFKAGNTICQRYVKSDTCIAIIKLDISGMETGQEAGLVHFNGGANYCTFGVVKDRNGNRFSYNEDGKIETGATITSNWLWICSVVDEKGINSYSYSENGESFIPFGGKYQLKWGGFRGDNIGIFNYNNEQEAGFIDIDWFHYTF
jgi:beta-xylosidase